MDASLFIEIDEAWDTAREQLEQEGVASADIEGLIPDRILENEDIELIDVFADFVGYARHYRGLPVIGLQKTLDGFDRLFALMHEIGHVLREHIYSSDFVLHRDEGLFTQEVYSPRISRHEKEANLIAADKCINTEAVLEAINYDCSCIREYREITREMEALAHKCEGIRASSCYGDLPDSTRERLEEYEERLEELDEQKQELMCEISDMDLNLTFEGMADALDISPTILRYKLEAMRLRGFDVNYQELEKYEEVFKDFLE